MKKRKLLTFLLAIVMVLPVMLLSACKDKNDDDGSQPATLQSVSVELAGNDYTLTDNTITTTYDGSLLSIADTDFVVKLVYSDTTTKTIAKDTDSTDGYTFTSTLPTEGTTNAGTYTLKFAYGELEKEISVVVAKAKINMQTASWNYTEAYTYNGGEKSIALIGLPSGVTAKYDSTGSVATATNAGTYSAVATLEYDSVNYELENVPALTKEWKINKATHDMSNVAWNYESAFDYNGTEREVVLTGLPTGVTATYTGNKATNANTYSAVATLAQADTANYEIATFANLTLSWTINKISYNMRDVEWNYSAPFTYDGLAKEVTLTGLPAGVSVVSYLNNAFVDAGEYTATVTFTQADVVNYHVVNANNYTLAWEIEKATYDMSNVYWAYYTSENPNVKTPYTEPLAFNETYAYTMVLEGLPTGVTIHNNEYIGTRVCEAGQYGEFSVGVQLVQADETNYELVNSEDYNTIWKVLSIPCIETVTFNGENKNQEWLERLTYLPVGSTLSVTPLSGYEVAITTSVGEPTTIQNAENGDAYIIRVQESGTYKTVFEKGLNVSYIDKVTINGEVYDYTYVSYNPESPTEQSITVTFGNCPITGESYLTKYAGRLFYHDGTAPVAITSETTVISIEDVYYIRFYIEDSENEFLYIIVNPYTHIEQISIKGTEDYEFEATDPNNVSVSIPDGFVKSFEVTLKEEIRDDYTVKLFNEAGTELVPAHFTNVLNKQVITIKVYNKELEVVEDVDFEIRYNFMIDGVSQVNSGYYIQTETNTLTFTNAKVDNAATLTLTEGEYGITGHTLKVEKIYSGTTYVFQTDLVVNYSPVASTYITDATAYVQSYEDSYPQSTPVDVENNLIYGFGGLSKAEIMLFNVDSMSINVAEGWTLVSKQKSTFSKINYLTITFESTTDSTTKTVYIYLDSDFDYDNDVTILGAIKMDYTTYSPVGEEYDMSGDSVNITDVSTFVGLYITTQNQSALIQIYSGGNLVDSDYGELVALFSEEGEYTLKITSSDESAIRTITLNVTGEFLPVVGVNYGSASLEMTMDGGMPAGNLEAFMSLTEDFFPTDVLTSFETLGLEVTELAGAFGYLPEAKDVTDDTITVEIVSTGIENGVFDIAGNIIADPANAELTIKTDAVYGKYVMFYGMDIFDEGYAPVIIFLSEKVYPVSFTLGTGENAITLGYQFDVTNMEYGLGNLHMGDFQMGGMGMVASASSANLGLNTESTTITLTVSFGRVYADYSYAVLVPTQGSEAVVVKPTETETPGVYTIAYETTFALTQDETAYYVNFYVAYLGATEGAVGEMCMPVTIALLK